MLEWLLGLIIIAILSIPLVLATGTSRTWREEVRPVNKYNESFRDSHDKMITDEYDAMDDTYYKIKRTFCYKSWLELIKEKEK